MASWDSWVITGKQLERCLAKFKNKSRTSVKTRGRVAFHTLVLLLSQNQCEIDTFDSVAVLFGKLTKRLKAKSRAENVLIKPLRNTAMENLPPNN